MLSRGNSDAATRLRRAKSASSVRTYRSTVGETNPIDPEVAHQHAVVAASRAYERGSPQKNANDASIGNNTDQGLGRRQSVRFTGPHAVSVKQRPITRRQAPGSTAPRPRLRGAASFDRGQDVLTRGPDGFTAASHPNEYVERRVSSTPSSYKKIRKTKSMFNPAKTPSLSFMSGSSKKRAQRQSQNLENEVTENPRPESGVHSRDDTSSNRMPRVQNQDAAIELARDTYVQQLKQQSLKGKSSFMDFAKPRKPAKAFRHTVRTSSNSSHGSANTSSATQSRETPKSTEFGRKARTVSVALKNRLKKVFQRPENEESVPKQQLNASRPYFGGYMFASNGVQQRYEHHIPSPDNETLRRVDSRGSTVRETSAFVEKPSNPASIRSVRSEDSTAEDSSRVSSWDNSTIASSLPPNLAREHKRLSVIHENGGPYQPSSSKRTYGDLNRRYAAFNDPIRDYSAGSLYLRLKKEIQNDKDRDRKHQIADLTPRGSSYRARNLSSGTISEEPVDNHDPFGDLSASEPRTLKSTIGNWGTPSEQNSEDLQDIAKIQQESERSDSGDVTPKGPLREVKSTFFPPSTRLERSSKSPFRRAKAASSEEGSVIHTAKTLETSTSKTSAAGDSRSAFLHVRSVSRSDSIYSRTTSGNTPVPSPSPPSLSDSESVRGLGSAVVSSGVLKYEKPVSPKQQRRTSSASSSGDWQKFMSHEVARFEARTLNVTDDKIQPASLIGHKRENAQFDDGDVEVGKIQTSNGASKRLLPAFQECITPRPAPKGQSLEDLTERTPLAEIRSSKFSPQNVQAPSKTSQSPDLRGKASYASLVNTSSNMNLNKRYGISLKSSHSESSDALRTASPLDQLRDRSNMVSNTRRSPERDARLQRMQSSNSIDSSRRQENKPIGKAENTPPQGYGRESARPSLVRSSSAEDDSPGSQLMIERFLKERRRDMRIGEESGADTVFL